MRQRECEGVRECTVGCWCGWWCRALGVRGGGGWVGGEGGVGGGGRSMRVWGVVMWAFASNFTTSNGVQESMCHTAGLALSLVRYNFAGVRASGKHYYGGRGGGERGRESAVGSEGHPPELRPQPPTSYAAFGLKKKTTSDPSLHYYN